MCSQAYTLLAAFAQLVIRPSNFLFSQVRLKARVSAGEADMRRKSRSERLKQRASEFKEADLARCAIDLLVWVHNQSLTLEQLEQEM